MEEEANQQKTNIRILFLSQEARRTWIHSYGSNRFISYSRFNLWEKEVAYLSMRIQLAQELKRQKSLPPLFVGESQ